MMLKIYIRIVLHNTSHLRQNKRVFICVKNKQIKLPCDFQ